MSSGRKVAAECIESLKSTRSNASSCPKQLDCRAFASRTTCSEKSLTQTGVHGMKKRQTELVRAVRPQTPQRRVGLIRLGKVVLLGLVLTATTATIATAAIGFVGETSPTPTTRSSVVSQPVTGSNIGRAAGAGTVLFWLGLAARNLRRKGTQENRRELRVPSKITPLPQVAGPQVAANSEVAA